MCCISTLMSNIKYLHNVTTPAVWSLWWLQEKRSQRESVEMRLRACFCVCDSERVCVCVCVCVCDPVCVVVSMAPGLFCSLLWVGHSRTRSSSVSDLSSSAQTHTRIRFISVWSNAFWTHTHTHTHSSSQFSPVCYPERQSTTRGNGSTSAANKLQVSAQPISPLTAQHACPSQHSV